MSYTKYVVVSTAQPREAAKRLLLLFEAEADYFDRVVRSPVVFIAFNRKGINLKNNLQKKS